jgi:hypothetical protein
MCDFTALFWDVFVVVATLIPEVESVSQPLSYRELDPKTGKFVVVGRLYEITTDDFDFCICITEVNAGAADAAVAEDAEKAEDAKTINTIKASIIMELCKGLTFILLEHGACHTMVNPLTHTITCAGSQFCLRVTLPIHD